MNPANRWAALGLTKPKGWGQSGSDMPLDLLMLAVTGGLSPTDDPIRAILEAVEDELATLSSALLDEDAENGHAATAKALSFRVRVARLLLQRADEIAAGERCMPEPPDAGGTR